VDSRRAHPFFMQPFGTQESWYGSKESIQLVTEYSGRIEKEPHATSSFGQLIRKQSISFLRNCHYGKVDE
jgi:hypothetical protein